MHFNIEYPDGINASDPKFSNDNYFDIRFHMALGIFIRDRLQLPFKVINDKGEMYYRSIFIIHSNIWYNYIQNTESITDGYLGQEEISILSSIMFKSPFQSMWTKWIDSDDELSNKMIAAGERRSCFISNRFFKRINTR